MMQRLMLILILAASLSGCAAHLTPNYPASGNVGRLMKRPDYAAAKGAAPEFTRDALKTVSDLQYQATLHAAPTK